jgi:protein phosphatase 1L
MQFLSYIALAGDSRAVLCRGGRAVRLNREHTAALDDERQRILAAGGTVQWRVDSWRVSLLLLLLPACWL